MAYFVRHSTATWRYQTPGPAWVAAFDQAHFDDGCPNPRRPVWVATVAEPSAQVIGYCCLSDFRSGEGYWPCSENSVYVLPDWAHAGIGRRLMEIVLAAGRDAGVYVVIAGVAGDNVASIRFHEQFGFKICGHLPKIGYKFDRWLDLTLLQLNLIDGRPAVPEPWPSQFERL
jgi:phosphinothricin acetyltransferase